MRMGYGLHVEQTQKLIMTPELRQAITVLQLSSLELSMYIDQQLQENPMLEVREDDLDRIEENEGAEGDASGGEEELSRQECDVDWEEYFHDSDLDLGRREKLAEQSGSGYENFLTQAPNLTEYLMMQLNLSRCGDYLKAIGEYIIGNVDHNGYLHVSVKEIAEQLEVSQSKVEQALSVIQSFDPLGVGASSLQECLLIQVRYLNIKNKLVAELIEKYLPDIAKGRLNQIAQQLGVAVTEVQEAADIIKTLDPKPGRNFSATNDVRYIVPDVIVERVEGEYIILVNDSSVPRLTINTAYRSVLTQDKFDLQTRRFVESKLNSAAWLLKSIEQRRLTLYKVASCLVDLQKDFMEYGVKHLKPLNLKTVAEIVGLHESTVSRATSNKYIQTPQGVFEMKFFFSTGLTSAGGGMTSAESIKKTLRELIASEDARKPLNDQKISDIFAERGIKISRRTVAKYRDELNIPPLKQRKRY
ncbi:RNA polymerase, sigma 54 subunit, RpoN [Desulfofarcimen acetoxidans DSM 771]|jgi:RNA polymerase sigma-54 factor|uniref:RNA polymerase, sigma 54 subunit, RpoN n=1 Tax=Desulfofarcimen acetoxidans (strain ATCC 49208 / DSM 771 / KCTC 5769 / VKM B-1644 / 5575) TaxID=485916 RepID=C8VY02_DESAS|nr:RNA polymerase factor sigma-54 [Desulfofarcimen acetoxidans]ACV64631.1 RNA polymerase, sigma 54 subunit, RpoN [Desulfofarcimen acetoxidans DSM 771]